MNKSKILVVGLIALLMAGGLVLAGCKDVGGCPNKGCQYTPPLEGMPNEPKNNTCDRSGCAVNKAASENRYSSSCACI
jgi:hypothetical protein